MINSATVATIHDLRVSTDENVGWNINVASRTGWNLAPEATL
jgi:hypothetical protein